ncbi:MAG: transcriptional regulator [Owenweeksia sp.]|nr:transcriptional regulator [Owenweeksia sp.]
MKNPIQGLHKEFENRIKLGIMSVLMVNDSMDFLDLKDILETTDGNLASHLHALEKKEMIDVKKQFVGKKPNTSYRATPQGRTAFAEHLTALENLIKKT